MPALLTSYGSLPLLGTTAFAELVRTIDAGRFCAFRTFPASCASTKFEVRLICSVRPQTFSAGTDGSGVGNRAAVLMTQSKPPILKHRRSQPGRDRVARRQIHRGAHHHLVRTRGARPRLSSPLLRRRSRRRPPRDRRVWRSRARLRVRCRCRRRGSPRPCG